MDAACSFFDASLPQPFPLPSASPHPLATPALDHCPHLDLSFAGTFLPTDVSPPSATLPRTAPKFRLPSFDILGIAAPHPDRPPLHPTYSFSSLGAGPLSKPEDPLHALSPPLEFRRQADKSVRPPAASPKATRKQVEHQVPTFTPPSEPGTFDWGSLVRVRTAGAGSPPSSEPGVSPNLTLTGSATGPGQAPIVVPTYAAELSEAVRMASWVQNIKNILTTESDTLDLAQVRVLSHALPCPSLTGHLFSQVIAAIHDRTNSQTSWINVFHAVPGRFTLSDLPKSPPSTPGPVIGGEEYFTSKVFDSAVAIPDYQLDSKLLPPSPQPVVPPGSINISLVERYIPPTNYNEYAEMFASQGRSLLYDRLVELSPDNGTLLFVYPTRTGGRTFMKEYLGPILDPLLRTVTIIHDLTSDLGKNLGTMTSVDYLDEYDQMVAHVEQFCTKLNGSGSSRRSINEQQATYELIHASKEEMVLERSAWADDWWIKQEKPRVREVVTKYFRKASRLPTSTEMTSAHLIEEVLNGVSKREYLGGGPKKGVEVGVFIIKKTRST
ncbi:uncharacterized protein M421DRAFT_99040 [Didymella exigua CBS 183.55]|uniref:Uncharacterized protein n=1 Tax=Didymella exigua CBS 183.55 TaxID=1150837 RepID=A0A6A5RXV4_9PLEO|nr:uncharacterized protein M421DRAFT_99040 [Didymella exigua CBS 183.55]KAF1931126.1 hypothetical protein M421DRAFT_99040 [Didymella exigua CBS 183.55]